MPTDSPVRHTSAGHMSHGGGASTIDPALFTAREVVVFGKVRGNIYASDRVDIRRSYS
jgi:hypothetical protein